MYALLGTAVTWLVIVVLIFFILSSPTALFALLWLVLLGITLVRYLRKKAQDGR
jgi:cell division protein FtsW (lipid II flippase)